MRGSGIQLQPHRDRPNCSIELSQDLWAVQVTHAQQYRCVLAKRLLLLPHAFAKPCIVLYFSSAPLQTSQVLLCGPQICTTMLWTQSCSSMMPLSVCPPIHAISFCLSYHLSSSKCRSMAELRSWASLYPPTCFCAATAKSGGAWTLTPTVPKMTHTPTTDQSCFRDADGFDCNCHAKMQRRCG